jgi:type VI protein secretion system component VasF
VEGLNSNLNLNEGSPPRVMPTIGEWAPLEVPTTRKKRRARWWTLLALLVVLVAVVGYGYWVYRMLR